MAEKIRTSDVIADEIKEKLKSGEVKGEEIADLFTLIKRLFGF